MRTYEKKYKEETEIKQRQNQELEVLNNVGFSEITSSEVDSDDYKLIKARKLK